MFKAMDALEGIVTPQYFDVLKNIKDRTKIVEQTFKAMFEEARARSGGPRRRSVISLMQEMRRMLHAPVKVSDVTLIMELSRNFDEFVNTVHTDATLNTLYSSTLTDKIIDDLVTLLIAGDVERLSQQIQDLRDYVAIKNDKKQKNEKILRSYQCYC